MYIILIVLLLFIIGFSIRFYLEDEPIFIGMIAGTTFGIIPSVVFGAIISFMIFGSAPMELKYTQDLIAMKDTSSVSASFFLGCGDMDSEFYYAYMVENEKGIKQYRIKQESNEVYIKYIDGQPYVEYWDKVDDPWRVVGDEMPYYIFYLPRGSVIETYEIDIE